MRAVRNTTDPNLRHQAYSRLASANLYDNEDQKAEAARLLSERLASGREPIISRAVICRTLGELKRPEGREAVIRALDETEPVVQTEAARALGKLGQPEDAAMLARLAMAGTSINLRIAAIESIGALRPSDSRYTTLLVDGMEHTDPAVRVASHEALCALAGRDLGLDAKVWRAQVTRRDPAAVNTAARPNDTGSELEPPPARPAVSRP
jgi:HEAT repeat protein